MQAIGSLENALTIYEAKNAKEALTQNHYGMALSYYTLGYLYYQLKNSFCDERLDEQTQYEQFYQGANNQNNCMTLALENFKSAYMNFKRVDHLFGMYMSKLNVINTTVFEEEDGEVTPEELKTKAALQAKLKILHEKFQAYGKEVGFEHSPYIKREHGDDISLMTEIVTKQSDQSLFPRGPDLDKSRAHRSNWT